MILTPATAIRKQIIDAQGNDLTFNNVKVFFNVAPDKPATYISIRDTGSGFQTSDRTGPLDATIQIIIRSPEGDMASDISTELRTYLESNCFEVVVRSDPNDPTSTITDQMDIIGIWISSGPAFLGLDEQKRHMWTQNYLIKYRPFDLGNRR